MPGRFEFDLTFGRAPRRRRDESEPLRILLMGDFSGKPAHERPRLESRPTCQVDLDTFDATLRRIGPRASTRAGDITFEQLDDFHPDELLTRIAPLRTLMEARSRPPEETEQLLDHLLQRADAPASPSRPLTGVDAFVHDIVAPHVVKDTSAQTEAHTAAVDGVLSIELRAVLHDPAFRSIEAEWRGAHLLVTQLELDETLQLHLFDVSREELVGDLVTTGRTPAESMLHRALVRGAADRKWSVVVSTMDFGPSDEDIGLLAGLGVLAAQSGGVLLAGAHADLTSLGDEAGSRWSELRKCDVAAAIALATPRVLLRAPYGTRSDPIERFPFEELDGPPSPDTLLWSSGSLALSLLIGRAFTARGWDMEPGDERELDVLPVYAFTRDGESVLQPATERVLTDRDIDALLRGGFIPLAGRGDRREVVAVRFQSIAEPPAPLAW